MITLIDNILNRITMYRLVLYYLTLLLVASFVFGFFGIIPNQPATLAFSVALITFTCFVTNWIFVKVFKAEANMESVYITAFILALIVNPVTTSDSAGIGFLIFISVWAMSSKYIFALSKKHVFNPVAIAVVIGTFALSTPATWWVGGNVALLPIVVIGGLLLVRKIQRFDLVLSFFTVALVTIALTSPAGMTLTVLNQTLLSSSIFFLAFVMLTEPLTTPPTRILRIIYGGIVGFLFAPAIHIGTFYLTPEIGLLIGNVFVYFVSPKGRHMLTLTRIEESARNVYNFVFTPDKAFSFQPGQYLEWTLGHLHPDSRGNRRYFTIASSPTEKEVHLGVKFYESPSSFKKNLANMEVGDTISASHLAGDFTLPKNTKQKLVFIAGGIGVTPFRSMVQYLLDKKEARDVVVLYANNNAEDIAYKKLFTRAKEELGIKTLYALSKEENTPPGVINGYIDAEVITREIPDYKERTFYISGPPRMVRAFQKTLAQLEVPRKNIKSDFFPGFA